MTSSHLTFDPKMYRKQGAEGIMKHAKGEGEDKQKCFGKLRKSKSFSKVKQYINRHLIAHFKFIDAKEGLQLAA